MWMVTLWMSLHLIRYANTVHGVQNSMLPLPRDCHWNTTITSNSHKQWKLRLIDADWTFTFTAHRESCPQTSRCTQINSLLPMGSSPEPIQLAEEDWLWKVRSDDHEMRKRTSPIVSSAQYRQCGVPTRQGHEDKVGKGKTVFHRSWQTVNNTQRT